jgi:hypothetical protein
MNRSKKDSPKEETSSKIKYTFSNSFKIKFDALVKAYSDSLESLNKMNSGKIDCDYGVCATTYHARYITPKNISTFVDNLVRAVEANFFHDNMNDVNMFIVASVLKFFEENGAEPVEDSASLGEGKHVDPKAWTLNDLEMVCANDFGPIAVYSKGEIVQRIRLMNDDLKKINEMHFAANSKKLVNALPKVINDAYVGPAGISKAIMCAIEDFLLFALTVNTCTVLQMYAYCNPATDYKFKKEKEKEDDEEKTITECCMCKTNDYMIRNRIPFNCNMRDIALQDVTPDFKDIHDAMHFILKDARSPICILVNKYATENGRREIHCNDIARMFLGVNRCHEHCLDDVFKKDGEEVRVDPLDDVANFQTHVDWLDTIAFGNNYLDGNYRRDAGGNNHVHPITNSLDMIFKMYGGIELKTNEEIADNILSVAGAIKSIVHAYREGNPIENYDLTKDILVLLGEILTRNMLRLYYNNTHVMIYRDDMANTMIPGFVNESFVMEMDNNDAKPDTTGTNNTEAGKADTKNGTVTFQDANGNEIKKADVQGIKKLMAKIAAWFKEIFKNFSSKFKTEFGKYVQYVTDHKDLNEEIGKALESQSFRANLNNFPNWTIRVSEAQKQPDPAIFEKYLNEGTSFTEKGGAAGNLTMLALYMLGIEDANAKNIAIMDVNGPNNIQSNWKATKEKLFDFYFFKPGDDKQITRAMGKADWENICNDLLGIQKTVDAFVDSFTKKQDTVSGIINKATNDTTAPEDKKARLKTLSDAYKVAFTDLARGITTNLANPIAKSRYTVYKATLDAYNTQKANSGNANANATQTENVEANATAETPAENAAPAEK